MKLLIPLFLFSTLFVGCGDNGGGGAGADPQANNTVNPNASPAPSPKEKRIGTGLPWPLEGFVIGYHSGETSPEDAFSFSLIYGLPCQIQKLV